MKSDVVKIMLILKDVRARESAQELEASVGPLLSFPCVFQVVPDKLVAYEQATMQEYDAIFLLSKCTETFPTPVFVEVINAIGGKTPTMIYMVDHKESVDHYVRRDCPYLRLTSEGSMILHDLARIITNVAFPAQKEVLVEPVVTEEPSARPETLPRVPEASLPVVAEEGTHRSSSGKKKRKHTRKEDSAPSYAAGLPAPYGFSMDFPENAAAYYQYMHSMTMHHQWLAQAQQQPLPPSQPIHNTKKARRQHALSEVTCESSDNENKWAVPVVTSSSDADGEGDAARDLFDCCLDGFEDMYAFLLDDAN